MKKFFVISGITLLIFVITLVSIPFLFKGKIVNQVKKTINEKVNAEVNFTDVDLSIVKHFPKLTFTLNNLSIVNKAPFAGDTLMGIQKFEVALNIISVLKGDYTIQSIYLKSPKIHVTILKDGKANWDIMKPADEKESATNSSSSAFKMQLNYYAIENGFVQYDDLQSNMYAVVTNLNHSGSGDFTESLFKLDTKTTMDELSYKYGGIAYINKAKTNYDAKLEINNANSKYTLLENDLSLNDFHLHFDGWFAMPKEGYDMDIKFSTPSTDFKTLFSLVPGAYTKDYSQVKSSGSMAFKGFVKGWYTETKMPTWQVEVAAKNGQVQYPTLPEAIKNINMNLIAACPDGVLEHTSVKISNGHLELGNAPFDFNLFFSDPMHAMDIDMNLKGSLDLGNVNKLFPMEGITKLNGIVKAAISAKGSLAAAQAKQFEHFYADGIIELSNVDYASKDFTKGAHITSMKLNFNPKEVTLENFTGSVSKTNISATGSLENVLPYVMTNAAIGGHLKVNMDRLNVDEWMTPTDPNAAKTTTATSKANEVFKVPANINFVMQATVNHLHYDKIEMSDLMGGVEIADQKMTLTNLEAKLMEGSMKVNGSYATKNSGLPDIDLSYDIKDWNIKKSFEAFNTVKKIAPIAEYMQGNFTTNLSMTGKMNADMSPELSSITGKGYFTIFNGTINNFKPIQKIAEVLQLKEVGAYKMPDLKTWFSIKNGRVTVDPFNIKTTDMVMGIEGSQGLDQTIDYTIHMDMPRGKLGTAVNTMLDKAVGIANTKGANFKADEHIKFDIFLGGSMLKPTVKTGLKEALKNKTNELKDLAKEELEKRKKELEDKAKTELEKKKQEAEDKARVEIEKQKKEAEVKAKEAIDKQKKDAEAKAKVIADKVKADADAKAKAEAEKLKNKGKDALNGLFKK